MKGVSEIIAIILILMIVIALAALAYTWFSGIFSTMTGTASSAVTTTTNAMNMQFSIDSARGTISSATIALVIRNTGTTNIGASTVSAYTSDSPCSNTNPTLIPPSTPSGAFNVVCAAAFNCPTCNNHVCTLANGNAETVTVTIGTGLQQIANVVC